MLNNSKILVTGGAGFIGSHLADALLKDGNTVVVLDNFSTGRRENLVEALRNPNFSLIEGDIRDMETCRKAAEKCDYVLHEAALGSVPRSIKTPEQTVSVNVAGFVNILTAARDAGVKRLVYASSSSVYGDDSSPVKRETLIGKHLSPYAVSKYADELFADIFHRLYKMELIGLRYFNVFGPRQTPEGPYAAAIPKFIKSMKKHVSPTIFGDGTNSRDFTYVRNVVNGNLCALTTNNPSAFGNVFNIAFGTETTLNELFHILKSNLSVYDTEIASLKPDYGPLRLGDIPHSLADISKARSALNYIPEFSVHDGLKLAVHWYWNNL